jgi:phosphoribosylformylglycinamidine synthase
MAQLVRANKALYDVTTAYKVPPISGKDSMKNDSTRGGRKISIPPTVLFSTIGKIDDIWRAVTMYYKKPGDAIYVIGVTKNELGASEFFRMLARDGGNPASYGGRAPSLDIPSALALYRAMNAATDREILHSSHTPTLGGLAAAFALAAIGGDLGSDIDLTLLDCDGNLSDDEKLFSESNSRFVVTCDQRNAPVLEEIFRGLSAVRVGEVAEERRLRVTGDGGRELINVEIDALRRAFMGTLYGV